MLLRQLWLGRDVTEGNSILGFVKDDPTAAVHIIDNNLIKRSALNQLAAEGSTKVPAFPITSVTLKPVFNPIASTWPGPPGDELPSMSEPFPESAWEECVWIDLENEREGSGMTDATCASRTAATTHNLDDFIHFEMSDKHARLLNLQNQLRSNDAPLFQADAPSILQAMHVTSRELTCWTWQTFWWSHQPDNPHFPSSNLFADTRPEQL